MMYRFKCNTCVAYLDLDIPISKYSKLKDKQKCPFCRSKLTRVIEWTGIASGSGDGWFGKSNGGKSI